jgi:hypothetical protein
MLASGVRRGCAGWVLFSQCSGRPYSLQRADRMSVWLPLREGQLEFVGRRVLQGQELPTVFAFK